MLPYFPQPSWHVGPISVHAFGVAVAVAVAVAQRMADQRAARFGLEQGVVTGLGGWVLAFGVLGAHLFSVLFYFPEKLQHDPWLLLRVWEDISSFGGMIGGGLGALLFFHLRTPDLPAQVRLAFADIVAFVFPTGLAIGRIGCALAHDHPGSVTGFLLGLSLKTDAARTYMQGVYVEAGLPFPSDVAGLGFHDLGLYELLFLALVILPLFRRWDSHARSPGFFLAVFAGLYLPVRFTLDFLRVSDPRYVGLTPAQWVAAAGLSVLPFFVVSRPRLRLLLVGGVIVATACACWGGTQG